MVADLSFTTFRTLATSLSFGEWVALGSPTDAAALVQAVEQSRQRVLESLAKLPAIQDERGLYLDELSPPARRCEGCGALLEATRVETAWMLPLHPVPGQDRPCMGAYSAGSES